MENPSITEILGRLPVKSLLQCRCVSKRWRHLIDSRFFVNSHLDQSVESSANLSLFPRDSSSLYCIDLGSPGHTVEIGYPLRWSRIKVLGSCRGLLCISKAKDRHVAIWNPSTRKHKLLPSLDTEIRGGLYPSACVHGFGYDNENDDYVLLRIVQIFEEPIEHAVSIYSLRANAWRRLQEIEMPYALVDRRKRGVFLHGRLHWIMTPELVPDMAKVLVAFNIREREFVEVDGLNFINNRLDMDLTVLGGCLCLIIYDDQRGVDVWIMTEYGSNGSWTRLLSIPEHERKWGLVQPLAYSPNRRQILVGVAGRILVWYDLQTNAVKSFDIRGMPNSFEAEICLRTLVPVNDYGRSAEMTGDDFLSEDSSLFYELMEA